MNLLAENPVSQVGNILVQRPTDSCYMWNGRSTRICYRVRAQDNEISVRSRSQQTSQLNPQQTDTCRCSLGSFELERHQVVIMVATRVDGIDANNTPPAEVMRDYLLWCMTRRASRAMMIHFCWRKTSRQRKMSAAPPKSFEVTVASLPKRTKKRFLAANSQGTKRVAEN